MRNTYLFGFGTFGHPNDYRQSPFKFDKEEIAKNIKIFDLSNAIKVFPGSTLYSIRKENIEGFSSISYAIYTFANEMNSVRDGTFIGSSILFTSEIAEENITINKLNEFHKMLVKRNTQNDVLKVNHSNNFKISNDFLNDFEKISYNLNPIMDLDNYASTNKHIIIGSRTDTNTLTSNFKNSLLLLNKFDTIFFTNSREIIEYCKNKGLYSITDESGFEQEIEKLKAEINKKRQLYIIELENEKQKLEHHRKQNIEKHKNQIEQNQKQHLENHHRIAESKNELDNVGKKYCAYLDKIDEAINNLKSNQKIEVVRQTLKINKNIFFNSINQQTQTNFINEISKQNSKPELRKPIQQLQHKNDIQNPLIREKSSIKKTGMDFFKVLSIALFLLWIITLTYFIFFYKTKSKNIGIQKNEESIAEKPNKTVPFKTKELRPSPNSELNEREYKIVAKNISKDMSIEEVVKIIFKANPIDINGSYSNQQKEYANELFEKNKNAFKETNGKTFFDRDTIRHILAYKKK